MISRPPSARPSPSAPPRAKGRVRLWRGLCLFVTAALWAAPGFASIDQAVLEPALPTFLDPLTLEVRGSSPCTMEPAAVQVRRQLVTFVLHRDCPEILGDERPFHFTFEDVGPLSPGEYFYEVGVVGLDFQAMAFGEFEVYSPAHIEIETPGAPLTDADPVTLRLTGYDSACSAIEDIRVDDFEVEIDVVLDCFILDPPAFFSLPADLGILPAGDYTVAIREVRSGNGASRGAFTVYRADGCVPSPTELCLNQDRFRVTSTWRDFEGSEGQGFAVPLEGRQDTGMFWFFNEDNVELTVKVLKGCGVNGHYWVFVSPGSTVDWTLEITDTRSGEVRVWRNGLGDVPPLIPATDAFATCP